MEKKFLILLLFLFSWIALLSENGNYFIAIDIPEPVETHLDAHKEMLEKQLFGTFEPKEKYHITLKYLGNLSEEQLSSVKQILQDRLKEQKRFTLYVKDLNFFPGIEKARVAWIGAFAPELYTMQKEIEDSMKKFSQSEKFQAHITLARLSYPPPLWLLEKFQKKVSEKPTLSFPLEEVLILKSIKGKYERVFSILIK